MSAATARALAGILCYTINHVDKPRRAADGGSFFSCGLPEHPRPTMHFQGLTWAFVGPLAAARAGLGAALVRRTA